MRGIPLMISVQRKRSKPLYQQIYDSFRAKIAHGDLRGGEPVPSTRELARQLGISRIPVLNAYSQLIAEGHLGTRPGAGTFIASAIQTRSPSSGVHPIGSGTPPRPISAHAAALPKAITAIAIKM